MHLLFSHENFFVATICCAATAPLWLAPPASLAQWGSTQPPADRVSTTVTRAAHAAMVLPTPSVVLRAVTSKEKSVILGRAQSKGSSKDQAIGEPIPRDCPGFP